MSGQIPDIYTVYKHTRSQRFQFSDMQEASEQKYNPEQSTSQSREDQLSQLLVRQMEMMEVITRRLEAAEQKQVETSAETRITTDNASKVVHSVLKSLGSVSKYSGNERNQYEAWTRFSTQLESAVGFYSELKELVSTEKSISDVANMKDLADMTPATNPFADEVPRPESIITIQGSATVASSVLSAILIQVTTGDAFDSVRRCGNDGVKAYRKLRARVEPQLFGQLASYMTRMTKLSVNSTTDPVKQLSAFADIQSSLSRYGGESLDERTIEVLTLAFAVSALPCDYATVVAALGQEAKPTFELLMQRCDYFFVNVLQQKNPTQYAAAAQDTDTAAVAKSLQADRQRQAEEKKKNDAKLLQCAVCSGEHSSESCWLMHPEKMEEFIKRNPAREAECRETYAKRKKRHLESQNDKAEETVAAAVSSTAGKMTDEEIWEAEEHDEVPVACPVVQHCGDQREAYAADALQQRVLHYDCMATKNVFNDLRFFEGNTVCAEKAVNFQVMAEEMTTSKGAGVVRVNLWNHATGKLDVLSVEAQYVPDSPFNILSAVYFEDKFDLYGQLLHRELISASGSSRYNLVRDGRKFILPESFAADAQSQYSRTFFKAAEDGYRERRAGCTLGDGSRQCTHGQSTRRVRLSQASGQSCRMKLLCGEAG